jgi:hypothetical protein
MSKARHIAYLPQYLIETGHMMGALQKRFPRKHESDREQQDIVDR